MAIIRIDVAESISSNPFALQQVVDQIIDQIDDLNTGATGSGGGGGDGDIYTLTATDGDGEVTVNLIADEGANSNVVMRAGNGMTINESGGTITFTAADGPDLGNYVTVNSSTGEIQAGTTTFQYLYRYLHIGFASDSSGTNFSTDPRTIPVTGLNPVIFIGTFNSSSLTPPASPSAYSYRSFVWSSEHNVFLRTVGGHQIEFLTSLQSIIIDASPFNADSDNPLDFDILQINNGNISDGAVSVEKLSIDQLSAITADVGDLRAGVLRGGNLTGPDPANNDPDAFGSYMSLTNGDVLFGDANTHFRFDATDDEISLIGDLATTNEIEWVPRTENDNAFVKVNSNTLSRQSANLNSHYAADGLVSITDGDFFVGHAETPVNDSTRQIDSNNSTGISISTLEVPSSDGNETFDLTVMANYGPVLFVPSEGAGGGSGIVWDSSEAELITVGNESNIRASKYENKGLSNDGNSVILGTDGDDRITANYPGGEILDFTQFSTGKQGSTSGQAIISNNQNLDLPAGSYAISIEELAATRRQVIYDLSGTVGQVSGETFNQTYEAGVAYRLRYNGSGTGIGTILNNVTSATDETYIDYRFDDYDTVLPFVYLFGEQDFHDRVTTATDIHTINIDSSRNLNLTVTNASTFVSLTVNGIRRVDLAFRPDNDNVPNRVRFWLFDPDESSNNADNFVLNAPNGINNQGIQTVSYDRGLPSGLILGTGNTFDNGTPDSRLFLNFNENIANNDELLTRFETEYEKITSIANNGNTIYSGQEVRLDNVNVQAIVTNNNLTNAAASNLFSSIAGTDGNFTATDEVFPNTNVIAHKFGIDPSTSNSVYGGWIQGNRYDLQIDNTQVSRNVGVNGIYDQSTGNFDIYGSRQFDTIPDNNNSAFDFEFLSTNNSNTEFVRSNYVLSDIGSSQPQTGLMIVSSVGPISLTGEFYTGVTDGVNGQVRGNLTDGAGIVMQYKEIQS